MRFKEIKPLLEQQLDEINMSPTSLQQLAMQINGVKVGMEFELCVIGLGDGEVGEPEFDFSRDEPCRDISDIIHFFGDGEFNSNQVIRRFERRLREMFDEWKFKHLYNKWQELSVREMRDLLTAHFESLGFEGEELDAAVEDELENPSREMDSVRDDWIEENSDDVLEEDFLLDNGWRYMADLTDIAENSGVAWPYYTESGGNGEASIEDVTDHFSAALRRPIKVAKRYHSTARHTEISNYYIAEPDSSIHAEDGDSGLEFVSPPLSVRDILIDLRRVADWCKHGNAYTNESTGLHMNISIPGYTGPNSIDYIKLALLVGDQYVLEQFGRLGNVYCKSALENIKQSVSVYPNAREQLLKVMRTQLNTAASKLVHTGETGKYISINPKDNRIEFRSPGGDWLKDFESGKIEQTLLRFIVAFDAAIDDTKYKEEYAKKLYKLLAPSNDTDDTIRYFASYAAGILPKAALKAFVKRAQATRTLNTIKQAPQKLGDYEVYNYDTNRTVYSYRSASPEEAGRQAYEYMRQHSLRPEEFGYRIANSGQPTQQG